MSFDNYCNHDHHHHHKDCPGYFVPPKIQIPRPVGPRGPQGIPGGVLGYAEFYASIDDAHPQNVAIGANVKFPQNGPTNNTISRVNNSTEEFLLPKNGVFLVSFVLSTDDWAHVVLTLDGTPQPQTSAGQGSYVPRQDFNKNQIIGSSLITTGNSSQKLALKCTDANHSGPMVLSRGSAGGSTGSTAMQLVITQIA